MAGSSRIADPPPLPLAAEGPGESRAPRSSSERTKHAESTLAQPSPASGRGLQGNLAAEMQAIGVAARAAARALANAASASKVAALRAAATAIRDATADILAANRQDLEAASRHALSAAMRDRLALDDQRVAAMARGLEEVANLPEPVGRVLAEWTQPNGLHFQRVSVPLGVIGIIYESRPNVTADAGGLCLKAGNAAILRGGSESFHSSFAIADCLRRGLAAAGLPEAAVQLVPTREREAVGLMLAMAEHIDVIVPRGGKSLIERVQYESRIPVLAHLEGLCHVYVDAAADLAMARAVVLNAKMRRTGVCGAAETLLVDRAVAATHLPPILADLRQAGCALRGDDTTRALDPAVEAASEADWTTEYLNAILAVRVIDGIEGAITHINRYGSHHTDAIVTENPATAERFLAEIDSAIVLVNASTQFADGGEFGMGAEIGISTGRLHARGPVGAEQLTTYKYVVRGNGQVRP
jgi:glutamate-5-semialdehyde dehydrogenase